jgi:hypothetical protein
MAQAIARSPGIIEAILAKRTDQWLILERLERPRPRPMSWEDQRSLLPAASTPITGTM